jgi:hypothetical protein
MAPNVIVYVYFTSVINHYYNLVIPDENIYFVSVINHYYNLVIPYEDFRY